MTSTKPNRAKELTEIARAKKGGGGGGGGIETIHRSIKKKSTPTAKPLPLPPRVGIKSQYIAFFGSLTNGKEFETQFVQVLAGEGAPTITGGWPEWIQVPRPQRVAMTVLQGYPPIQLSIPIQFEAVANSSNPMHVEEEIRKLEWMAGRSAGGGAPGHERGEGQSLFAGKPGQDALGDSPLVNIYTSNNEIEIPLVPIQFQGIQYVLTSIDFDPNPLREEGGHRLRQLATVTALEFVAAPGTDFNAPSTRFNQRNALAHKGEWLKTTTAINTVNKIALRYTGTTRTVNEILEANKSNKVIGHNPDKKLPIGTRVFLPFSARLNLNV